MDEVIEAKIRRMVDDHVRERDAILSWWIGQNGATPATHKLFIYPDGASEQLPGPGDATFRWPRETYVLMPLDRPEPLKHPTREQAMSRYRHITL